MAQILRLGIAGLGNAGDAVVRNLGKVTGVMLAAVADVRQEVLKSFQEKYPGVGTFESVEEMCRSPKVDAVWIATPNEFHAEHVVSAASAGKHVVCEKPMALSLEECDRMIEAAERSRVQLLMHSKVNESPVARMREVVQSGRLGRLIQINTWNYKGWLDNPRLSAELDVSRGGGVLYRQGPHQVDIVRYIGGGGVKSVLARVGRRHPHIDTEGDYAAFLLFEDGAVATLVFNGYGYFDITELTWDIGEGGGKVLERYARKERPKGAVDAAERYAMPRRAETRRRGEIKQPFYGLTLVSCEKGDMRQSPEGLFVYTADGREEIPCARPLDRARDLERLRDAVMGDGHAFPDGRWGKATLEVVLAIRESSRRREEVALSCQVPSPL